MKVIILLLALVSPFQLLLGQKTDSIKYPYGYLYFHEYGSGEPVLILSGGPGISCDQLKDVALNLGLKYRAILLEQRGSGRSIPKLLDSITINLKTAIADISMVLNHLNLNSAIILGHSWGGVLAQAYAAANPDKVKALILVSTGTNKFSPETEITFETNQWLRLGACEKMKFDSLTQARNEGLLTPEGQIERREIVNMTFIYDKTKIKALNQQISKGVFTTETNELISKDISDARFDLSEQIHRFKKPFYVICGRQDPLAYVSYELKILHPATKLLWIQSCGHYPMFEQPEAFFKLLDKTLTEINN